MIKNQNNKLNNNANYFHDINLNDQLFIIEKSKKKVIIFLITKIEDIFKKANLLANSQERKFILEKYKEINEQLNQRTKIINVFNNQKNKISTIFNLN